VTAAGARRPPLYLPAVDLAAQLTAHPAAALPVLFGAGVLTSLTPCVYPMIPITAAIVGGQTVRGGAAAARGRVVFLTLAYVLGLAAVYAGLGLFAGLTGHPVRQREHQPVAVLLHGQRAAPERARHARRAAGAPAGRARPPRRDRGHRGPGNGRVRHGRGLGPRGRPVLGAGDGRGAHLGEHHPLGGLGFLYLFTFSLGMCALLVAVGLSSGALARLPRAGAWMLWVKRAFALLMIGAAEYYLVQMGTVWF
jgi:thiol:disulfide interchange protein DsbD